MSTKRHLGWFRYSLPPNPSDHTYGSGIHASQPTALHVLPQMLPSVPLLINE